MGMHGARFGRYLAGYPRVIQEFKPQKLFATVRVYCDSDHAGDLKTRKSTTGIVCMLGMRMVKHSSMSTISLSSGESEYYVLVKAGATGLGLKAMLEEWKISVQLVLFSDSSAARNYLAERAGANPACADEIPVGARTTAEQGFRWEMCEERSKCE